jgi:glutamate racemase
MDSGIGGLPYLARARELLPDESFLYLADTEGFPYGGKDAATISGIVLDRVERLVRWYAPKALVIACNTASQLALEAIRRRYPALPVIGTVPALKPAAQTSRKRRIGVLATESTVHAPYLDRLVRRYAQDCFVLRIGAPDLVRFVEKEFLHSDPAGRSRAVAPRVEAFMEAGVDRIVLACTHFLHLSADIGGLAREIDPGASTVDSCEGVSRRLVHVLRERRLTRSPEKTPSRMSAGQSVLKLSGRTGEAAIYREWALKYGLSGPGILGY